MLGREPFPGVASFVEASSQDACSGPSVSLSSNLRVLETIP